MQIPTIQPTASSIRPPAAPAATSILRPPESAPVPVPAPFARPSRESLMQAIKSLPDSRPEVVARGKALAANPNYPPLVIINKLAGLFVADGKTSAALDRQA